jgi:HTH-type transcriptional repressor of NAD biosynthesis genes
MPVTGSIIGKFFPFHKGHHELIRRAAAQCDELFVLMTGNYAEEEIIPLAVREAWLQELVAGEHVHINVRLVEAPIDYYDPDIIAFWGGVIIEMVAEAAADLPGVSPTIDKLFTSEGDTYGDATAAAIGAAHICVDPTRQAFPISGTAIRANPLAAWDFLEPPVRAYFVKRIRVLGGESSGKTTFTDDLARYFATTWISEWGRAYSRPKDRRSETWTTDDFVAIARRKVELEDLGARRANRLLLCDTDAETTGLWHEVYLGHRAPEVDVIGEACHFDLTLVADNNIPWVQDGFRHSAEARAEQQQKIIDRLEARGLPYFLISGDRRARVKQAAKIIEKIAGLRPPPEGEYWLRQGLAKRWRYLHEEEHPWRRSLFFWTTGRSACEIAEELLAQRLDYETLAAQIGCPAEAVREADWYNARHIELAYAEARGDLEDLDSFTDEECL